MEKKKKNVKKMKINENDPKNRIESNFHQLLYPTIKKDLNDDDPNNNNNNHHYHIEENLVQIQKE